MRSLDNCDWKVVGVSYISELVTAKEMELLGNICVMLTIILLVTMLVSFLVSRLVTNPVQRLIRAMGEFERMQRDMFIVRWKGLWRSRHYPSPMSTWYERSRN